MWNLPLTFEGYQAKYTEKNEENLQPSVKSVTDMKRSRKNKLASRKHPHHQS